MAPYFLTTKQLTAAERIYPMSITYNLEQPNIIYYDCADPVALKDVIRSLKGLDGALKALPPAINQLLNLNLDGIQFRLEAVETGSELIRFWTRLRFRNDEERDAFIYQFGQKHPKLVKLIDFALAAFVAVTAYKMAAGTDQPTTKIEAANSVIITAGRDISGLSEVDVKEIIENTIKENPGLYKSSLDLLAPARPDSSTSISFGDGASPIVIPAAAIAEVPLSPPPLDIRQEIDYQNVLLDIRATDLDYRSKGWSALAAGFDKRLAVTLYPHINTSSLKGATYANISILYKIDPHDESRMIPANIVIKSMGDSTQPAQAIKPFIANTTYDPPSTIADHVQQKKLF
ncbi:hypothetical protein [Alcaligenes faecalis]|uniref:hypothetical protein n=1 Tax=Alcaligenes faecalis TaxID=511 RepID=UPI001931DC6F|nr:hypothetical protein [Alcaligenes faecalis]